MRLWYHPESDSLFWDNEYPNDGLCEDVTGYKRFRDTAKARGIEEPFAAHGYNIHDDPDVISGRFSRDDYTKSWAEEEPGKIIPDEDVVRVIDPLLPRDLKMTAEVTSQGTGSIANAIIASYKKWERKPADLYPTPVDATESIIPMLKVMRTPDGRPIKRIWEPACGDGRISRVLEHHGFDVISTDLREYPGYGTGGIDFLNDDLLKDYGWDIGEIDLILTNPPFSLAEAFIRRACELCPNVVMLLKQTYWNTKGRIALWEEHMPALELKITWRLAFLKRERGNSPLMDCMWCAWYNEEQEVPHCVAEPLRKRVYPGYDGIGIKAGLQVLEGEIDALTKALAEVTSNVSPSA